MKKIYYADENFIRNILGINNVITSKQNIVLINSIAMKSGLYEFDDLESIKNSDLFNDVKYNGGFIFLNNCSSEEWRNLIGLSKNEDVNETFNYLEADKIYFRLYNI